MGRGADIQPAYLPARYTGAPGGWPGVKSQEFLDFNIVAKLMKNKEHLTQEGLEQISQIKSGMNTQRK